MSLQARFPLRVLRAAPAHRHTNDEYTLKKILSMYVFVHFFIVNTHMWWSEDSLMESLLFPPCGSWGLNAGHQAW